MKHFKIQHWLVLLLLPCTTALGQTSRPSSRPSFTTSRFDENYSFLRDPAQRTDFLDPIKYIPLDGQVAIDGFVPSWYASLGGQVRDRYEYFNNNLFGTGPQTRDGFNLLRLTENLDVHMGDNARVFLQAASAFEDGRAGGPRPSDHDELDLEQGFGELIIPLSNNVNIDARAGRQYLRFGAERLIGPADYTNTRHTFDGVRADLNSPWNSLDLFLTRPVLIKPEDWDNMDGSQAFVGVYDILKAPETCMPGHAQLETYALFLDRQGATLPTRPGKGFEDVYTFGGRFSSNPKPFDFDIEGDYQTGSFLNDNISAFALATKDGFTLENCPLKPRIFVGGDVASGTRKNTGTISTFNQLFPSGHAQFGNIDAIGRQNIVDVDPGIDLTLLEHEKFVQALWVRTSFYEFWRESSNDAVYQASGAVLRAAAPGARASYVGNEIDIQLNWQIDPHFSTYIGYSHFFAGTFISQTGPSKDIDYAFAALTWTF